MPVSEQDLELIDAVYGATTGENTLNDSIRSYLSLQDESAGVLFHFDSIMNNSSDLEIIASDEELVRLAHSVFDTYSGSSGVVENPLITASFDRLAAGEILASNEVMPYAELQRTDYYRQVMEPLGVRISLGLLAGGRGQKWLTLASSSTEKRDYTDSQFARARLFQSHVSRAIHLLELLDEAGRAKKQFENAMQRMPYGIVLVDDDRRVLFHNAPAGSLVSRSRSLALPGGRLEVGATAHQRSQFGQWWKHMVASMASDGASYSGADLDFIWEIEASRVAALSGTGALARRWMLTLKERSDSSELTAESIQRRFDLTPAEARVCLFLCSNGDAVSAARAMELSPNTVRTHLKSVFNKTNTRNQGELAIALVAR